MRVVARMSGLSADTIRAWERRYNAVVPERSAGNTRRFKASDVRRLVLLREATEQGHAISWVAQLPDDQLESLVEGSTTALPATEHDMQEGTYEAFRESYLNAIVRFDSGRAWNLLQRAATFLSPRDFVFEVCVPLVKEVGKRWVHAKLGIAQEHLVSAQLSSLVNKMVANGPPRHPVGKVLLTTPAGHVHTLGLLVGALLVDAHDYEGVYLGPDLPDEEIIWSMGVSRAELLMLSVAADMKEEEARRRGAMIDIIARQAEVWIGCPPDHALVQAAPRARFFHDYESLDVALVSFKQTARAKRDRRR